MKKRILLSVILVACIALMSTPWEIEAMNVTVSGDDVEITYSKEEWANDLSYCIIYCKVNEKGEESVYTITSTSVTKTVVDPTCIDAGYTRYTANYDTYSLPTKGGSGVIEITAPQKDTDEVAPLGHNYQDGVCTRCGAIEDTGTTTGCEHSYKQYTTEGGIYMLRCEKCGDETEDTHEHVLEEKTAANYVAPTCLERGYYLLQCTDPTNVNCQYVVKEIDSSVAGDLADHIFEVTYTWTEDLSQCTAYWKCKNCGQDGSTIVNTTKVKHDPQCLTDGYWEYEADFSALSIGIDNLKLQVQKRVVSIPATGHTFSDGKCVNCGLVDSTYVNQSNSQNNNVEESQTNNSQNNNVEESKANNSQSTYAEESQTNNSQSYYVEEIQENISQNNATTARQKTTIEAASNYEITNSQTESQSYKDNKKSKKETSKKETKKETKENSSVYNTHTIKYSVQEEKVNEEPIQAEEDNIETEEVISEAEEIYTESVEAAATTETDNNQEEVDAKPVFKVSVYEGVIENPKCGNIKSEAKENASNGKKVMQGKVDGSQHKVRASRVKNKIKSIISKMKNVM